MHGSKKFVTTIFTIVIYQKLICVFVISVPELEIWNKFLENPKKLSFLYVDFFLSKQTLIFHIIFIYIYNYKIGCKRQFNDFLNIHLKYYNTCYIYILLYVLITIGLYNTIWAIPQVAEDNDYPCGH